MEDGKVSSHIVVSLYRANRVLANVCRTDGELTRLDRLIHHLCILDLQPPWRQDKGHKRGRKEHLQDGNIALGALEAF